MVAGHCRGHVGGIAGLDTHIDDGDCAGIHCGDRLFQRFGKIGRIGDRTEARRALSAAHGGEIDFGIGHALADPLVLDRTRSHARNALLVQLVVIERAIVGDHEQERNFVMHRCPHRGHAHEVIAVAANGDRQPAGILQRQRGTDGNSRAATDAAAAVGPEIVERMAERPPAVLPRDRQVGQRDWPLADDFSQRVRDMFVGETGGLLIGGSRRRMRHRARLAAGADRFDQLGHDEIGIGGEKKIDGRQSLMVHAPAVVDAVIERDLNDFRCGGGADGPQRAGKVDPVQAQNDVGVADGRDAVGRDIARCAGVERMIGRETRADLEVGDDAGVERFGKRDAGIPRFLAAGGASSEDHDLLGRFQRCRRLVHQIGGRGGDDRRHVARSFDRRQRLDELGLLHFGIEIDVDRALRRRVRDPGAAQQRFACRAGRGRLVVPLGVAANECTLIARGVDPIDPRAPMHGIDRTGRSENDDRHAIAPGVEHRHRRVLQTDIRMHCGRDRLAGDLGVAVSDGDGGFLVHAQQHLRCRVAEIVDDAVVQAAVARTRRHRDVRECRARATFPRPRRCQIQER